MQYKFSTATIGLEMRRARDGVHYCAPPPHFSLATWLEEEAGDRRHSRDFFNCSRLSLEQGDVTACSRPVFEQVVKALLVPNLFSSAAGRRGRRRRSKGLRFDASLRPRAFSRGHEPYRPTLRFPEPMNGGIAPGMCCGLFGWIADCACCGSSVASDTDIRRRSGGYSLPSEKRNDKPPGRFWFLWFGVGMLVG